MFNHSVLLHYFYLLPYVPASLAWYLSKKCNQIQQGDLRTEWNAWFAELFHTIWWKSAINKLFMSVGHCSEWEYMTSFKCHLYTFPITSCLEGLVKGCAEKSLAYSSYHSSKALGKELIHVKLFSRQSTTIWALLSDHYADQNKTNGNTSYTRSISSTPQLYKRNMMERIGKLHVYLGMQKEFLCDSACFLVIYTVLSNQGCCGTSSYYLALYDCCCAKVGAQWTEVLSASAHALLLTFCVINGTVRSF